MKTWFQNHSARRKHSGTQLRPFGSTSSNEVAEITPPWAHSTQIKGLETAARLATSKTSSRMSIERYLSAPLEDEPASVPAINAALKQQNSQNKGRKAFPRGHSRESSFDANSDGKRTFYTSGSAPESSGTSYSVISKTHRRQQSSTLPGLPELPKLETSHASSLDFGDKSPERPTTSGTIDAEKTWAGQMSNFMPGYDSTNAADSHAKTTMEIARIQAKARLLEEQLRIYRTERENADLLVPRVTDEMAYAQMAARPKLAWILGGDASDVRSIERPKSSGSAIISLSDTLLDRPSSSGTLRDPMPSQAPRRSKSSGALNEKARQMPSDRSSRQLMDGKPSRRARFYCTFCQKRFHSRLEWTRHEQTIHMPEELWICCPRTGEFPDRCPFCAKIHPSPSHLADHNYLSCQEKPLSERTFSRKDHFLQHLSHVHRISASQKPQRLVELVETWRHPLPLKTGHQALHCGFCGKTFASYTERTHHVGNHFLEGLDMMSWWDARVSHDIHMPATKDLAYRNPDLPHKCSYCERTYINLAVAQKLHPVCTMWSCSFLPGMQYTIYPAGSRAHLQAVCCYCNETLVQGAGKVKGSVLKDHVHQHNFRTCNQRLYFSGQRFRQHLQDNHKTNYDATLFAGWTLLLKSSKRQKPALFEAVEASAAVRRAYTDPEVTSGRSQKKDKDIPATQKLNFMDLSETPRSSFAPKKKKLQRKASNQTLPEKPSRELRESTHIFSRANTVDLAYGAAASPSPRVTLDGLLSPGSVPSQHKPGFPIASLPVDAVNACPKFFRRRLDASTRNRLYVRDENDLPLSRHSQRLFRKVPASSFAGLVLHTSLIGATPARMTPSVDIYSLH